MKTTLRSPGGRIVIEPSATRASVQVTYFPADGAEPPRGLLIPNAQAGIAAQAIEAVATLNEESAPPELPASALAAEWKCRCCGQTELMP